MGLGNGASASVRPAAETRSLSKNCGAAETAKPDFARVQNGGAAELHKPDFELALDRALAPFNRMMSQRQRTEAIARARSQILLAVEVAMKAERRRVVAELTPAQLRKEVRELLDSHTELLDYLDDLERQPVIAGEVRRLRARGEIPWPL
jgi:hypothetical protein